jgi:hypothetical protein
LHKRARTTPPVRAEIAASPESVAGLAQRFGISEAVCKWRSRDTFGDRPHTAHRTPHTAHRTPHTAHRTPRIAHRLQTPLTPAQEVVAVELRRMLLLPLDDLLAVMREFVCPDVSRPGLGRCLRRHGVG